MLRFFFWGLLVLNAFLLAFNLGYLGHWSWETHEPSRLKMQHHVEQLLPLTAAAALASAPAPVKKAELIACLELGNFLQSEAAKVEEQLQTLALGDRQSRLNVSDVASHMVYIPSQGSKEGADKKVAELRRIGVADFFVMQENTALRWGISLGVFKSEEAAKQHLLALSNKGVHTARIMPRTAATSKFAYQLRALTQDEKARFDLITVAYPNQEVRTCQNAAYRKN
ncbi:MULTISPECIES: SPOR domain-containing protein [unclassified Undibacterium]|uniref:SPOR domain-containing protein n=1 Tax=unclassified Undibacterium TaxID=2630295 RepID=UPI002AC93B12|nr:MULTISPECIES: SPOR domain-containing protein [unclassified Undibacterium]MEB0137430.1 SPOR domain-containing protein [Undibacterium sp. CCC2.1]MEB0170905.1 SPOR domain-containing protein [Undibacterium sp. CCC1.1]MEB0174857.1 SPOR domain-containing protein [Undibacterium sp. CCC3.4]MEB0214193.1 SPOR domain-containing protein [Undibacterium sp. 5I2]WPX44504.1 SPOR domain-containing protein [Undibacterium sp. CCC3.4]